MSPRFQAIGIVANPNAGLKRTSPSADASRRFILQTKLQALLRPEDCLTWTINEQSLIATLENYREAGYQTIGILGGDGSLALALTAIHKVFSKERLPKILPLRGGTMNAISYSLGLRAGPLQILAKFLAQRQAQQQLTEKPLLLQQIGERLGCIFGCGCFARFVQEYNAKARPRPAMALFLLLLALGSTLVSGKRARRLFQPVKTSLKIDDLTTKLGSYTMLTSSTVRHAGFYFQPYFLAEQQILDPHLIYSEAPPGKLFRNLPQFFRGQADKQGLIRNTTFEALTINPEKPEPLFVDGEIIQPAFPLTIRRGPQFRCLIP